MTNSCRSGRWIWNLIDVTKLIKMPKVVWPAMPKERLDSPLLTPQEAVMYLRLDEERELAASLRALDRLVDKRLLRPCIVGKRRRYSRAELDWCIDEQTDRWGDCS